MKLSKFLVVFIIIALLALPPIIFFDKIYVFLNGQKVPPVVQNNIQRQTESEEDLKKIPIKVFSNPSLGYQFSYKSIYDIRPETDHFNLLNKKNNIIATIKVVDNADRETEESLFRESLISKEYNVTVEDISFSNATFKIIQAVKENNQTESLLTLTNSVGQSILINTVDPAGFANYPDDIYLIAETFGIIE